MTEIMQVAATEQRMVPLASLKSLESVSFFAELPEHATRELDHAHVNELFASVTITANGKTQAIETFPPLKVVATNEGPVIVDGYHRLAAIQQHLRSLVLALDLDALTPLALGRALKAPLTTEQQTELDKLLNTVHVPVEIGTYKNVKAVAIAALTANLTHGLPPRSQARVHMAVEYYKLTRGDDNAPNQSAIARMFGIGRSSLNEYLVEKPRQEQEKAQAAKEESAEGGKEEKVQPSKLEKVTKRLDTFVKDLEAMLSDEDEQYNLAGYTVIHRLLPVVLKNLHDVYATDDSNERYTKDVLVDLGLSPVNDVPSEHLEYIKRFSSVLTDVYNMRVRKQKVAPKKASKPTKVTLDSSESQHAPTAIDASA